MVANEGSGSGDWWCTGGWSRQSHPWTQPKAMPVPNKGSEEVPHKKLKGNAEVKPTLKKETTRGNIFPFRQLKLIIINKTISKFIYQTIWQASRRPKCPFCLSTGLCHSIFIHVLTHCQTKDLTDGEILAALLPVKTLACIQRCELCLNGETQNLSQMIGTCPTQLLPEQGTHSSHTTSTLSTKKAHRKQAIQQRSPNGQTLQPSALRTHSNPCCVISAILSPILKLTLTSGSQLPGWNVLRRESMRSEGDSSTHVGGPTRTLSNRV